MNLTDTPEYLDPSLPVDRRVDDLLDRMTLEETVAQLVAVGSGDVLDDDGNFDRESAEELLEYGLGHVTRLGGGGRLDPKTAAEAAEELQTFLTEETRLGVPAVLHEECLSGYMGAEGTTYPQGIGVASTWAPGLVEGMTARIREQLLAIGSRHALSPMMDVVRDPRWGRTEESYGEDPTLAAAIATSYINGLQGGDHTEGVSATAKHFAAHGAGEGGKNHTSVQIGERELREVHLLPFEAAVREADVESVMNAYNDIDGVPCASSEWLLTDVLRGEWGFDGNVVSDYFSVRFLRDEHGVADTLREAAVQSVEAGIDMDLPAGKCYGELADAVRNGAVARETIDTAARRVLRQKIEKGLVDDPGVDTAAVDESFGPEAGREFARKMARESITLLKNEDDLLPIGPDESVAVVGPKSDTPAGQVGDYAYAAHYPTAESNRHIVTPLEAFGERLGEDRVTHAEGCTTTGPDTSGFDEAVSATEGSDVAVVFVGTRSAVGVSANQSGDGFEHDDCGRKAQPDLPTSGEAVDMTDLKLPGVQHELLERLDETDTPLVVVQISGRPHSLTWADESVDAIVHAWLPGEEGGNGIADVLLGEHSPSGRLPLSIPKAVGQIPVHYSRKPKTYEERYVYVDNEPLYPFGYGESYTDFEYSELELDDSEVPPAGAVTGTVTVENTGDIAGHEVVQFYSHQRSPSQTRPVQELVGFQRVHLEPGESITVQVKVPTEKLAFHDRDMDLVVEPGEYELRVGQSAAEIESTTNFAVDGPRYEVPQNARAYVAETNVDSGAAESPGD